MKALVIGATGATGELLVDELLADQNYTRVTIFVRRPTGKQNPKLVEHVINFSSPETYKDLIVGDVLFSCLGTTLKAAGTKENQWKIDFEIPAAFATFGKENGVSSIVLLSAFGASSESKVFYSQIKGKLEDKITRLDFEQYIIFRPGLLLRAGSDRFVEKIMGYILKGVNAIGLFRKFRPMPTALLAEKLVKAPTVFPAGTSVIELDEIFRLRD